MRPWLAAVTMVGLGVVIGAVIGWQGWWALDRLDVVSSACRDVFITTVAACAPPPGPRIAALAGAFLGGGFAGYAGARLGAVRHDGRGW